MRTRLARAFYRRTSLPFRVAFMILACLRSRRTPLCLSHDSSDTYLDVHIREDFRELWKYGYHRVFDLLANFSPVSDLASLRVLSIGPRTEIELYYLWLFFGFSWKNIVGVDIVSPSQKITLGDMSVRLPFEDNSFDVIVASHCLEKSRNPEKTRDEIMRVAKRGARVLICGDRPPEGVPLFRPTPIPLRFFDGGAYGVVELYKLDLRDIEYMNARSPHGFEIIFEVKK